MESTNNIPDKEFYDIGVVVDNYKLNAFSKAFKAAGFDHVEIHPFTQTTTTLKVMQVPKASVEGLGKLIKNLNSLVAQPDNKRN